MSKSKGNIIDPLDIVDGISLDALLQKRTKGLMQPQMAQKIAQDTKQQFPEGIPSYGTDALRFTFCSLATNGRHLRFDLTRLESYRNFCTKLWNAARYVFMNSEQVDTNAKAVNLIDRWILSRWQNTKQKYLESFDNYRFDLAAQAIYEFTWNEYCDWYLELSKPTLNNTNLDISMANSTRATLKLVLGEILQVLHPIMPFITEEIWQKFGTQEYLITHSFPLANINLIEPEIEATVTQLQAIIIAVRTIRAEMNLAPSKPLPMLINNASVTEQAMINKNSDLLISLAKLSSITWLQATEQPPAAATALAGKLQILIPMQGLIDKDAEIIRLNKEIEKISKDLAKTHEKLANSGYTNKAPAEVVAKERQRLVELQSGLSKLQDGLETVMRL